MIEESRPRHTDRPGTESLPTDPAALRAYALDLRARLDESGTILAAIRGGDIDALMVVPASGQSHLYTLQSADIPFHVLIEQMQEGAVTMRADGTIQYANQRVAEILGIPRDQVIGTRLQPFARGDDAVVLARMLDDARHRGTRKEITLCSRSGEDIPIQLSLSFLRNDDDVTLLCGVLTDLTEQSRHRRDLERANASLLAQIAEREKAEAALGHAQKMEVIGNLAAGIAHDFNNILQSIVGALDLVMDELADGSQAMDYALMVIAAVSRGSSLTEHLLNHARQGPRQARVIEIGPFLTDMQKMLARTVGSRITVEIALAPNLAILADPGFFSTALLNLAINASHAMAGGGTLLMRARDASEPGRNLVSIAVIDSGSGMDEATLARAVEPFFTTKGTGGTGLGLGMVQGFATDSGGEFRMTSVPGRGTTVELRLPAAAWSTVDAG